MELYEMRRTIEKIDALRKEASVCRSMVSRWVGRNELDFVLETTRKVKKMLRGQKVVRDEIEMTKEESDIFLVYVQERGRRLDNEADELEKKLAKQ